MKSDSEIGVAFLSGIFNRLRDSNSKIIQSVKNAGEQIETKNIDYLDSYILICFLLKINILINISKCLF